VSATTHHLRRRRTWMKSRSCCPEDQVFIVKAGGSLRVRRGGLPGELGERSRPSSARTYSYQFWARSVPLLYSPARQNRRWSLQMTDPGRGHGTEAPAPRSSLDFVAAHFAALAGVGRHPHGFNVKTCCRASVARTCGRGGLTVCGDIVCLLGGR
jgi:hypothetical protein